MSDSLFGDLDLESAQDDPFQIPDGSYLCYVTDSKVGPTKNGDKIGLTLHYTISEGDHNGKIITEWKRVPAQGSQSAEDKRAASFIKQRMLGLGIPQERLNKISRDDVLGIKCVVAIKNSNGFTNVKSAQRVAEDFSTENFTDFDAV